MPRKAECATGYREGAADDPAMVAAGPAGGAPSETGGARPDFARDTRFLRRLRLSRGRYAGLAGKPRAGAAPEGVRDGAAGPTRRRRQGALSAHLARVRDEEAARRRDGADLAAGARVSQRRTQRDPPPRIRDARMVPGGRVLSRPDGGMRGAAAGRTGSCGHRCAALAET